MSFSSELNKKSYDGNDSTTVFSFPYLFQVNGDLTVIKTDSSDNETTLVLDTDYSVSGAGNDAGGSVTYPISGSPLATGEKITIVREMDLNQEVDLSNDGAYFLESLESVVDRTVMMIQQLKEISDRSVKDTISSSLALPTAQDIRDLADGLTSALDISSLFSTLSSLNPIDILDEVMIKDLTPSAQVKKTTVPGLLKSVHVNTRYCNEFTDINAAVTAIGSVNPTRLVVSDSQTLTANLTVTDNIALVFERGGEIVKASTYILNIKNLIAGSFKIFDGFSAGNITLSPKITVNPLWFGVTGDGSTDDATAFQVAIDSISTTGGLVLIPALTHIIGTALAMYSNVKMKGMGAASILKLKNNGNTNVITGTSKSGVILEDFVIDGNKANNTDNDPLIDFTSVTNSILRRLVVHDGNWHGINLSCSQITIDNCISYDNGGDGLVFPTSGATEISEISVIGGHYYDNDAYGIGVVKPASVGYGSPTRVSIVGAHVWNNGTYGINFKGVTNSIINSCVIYLNGQHGINSGDPSDAAYVSDNNVITNNVIYNNGQAAGNHNGVYCHGDNNIINNNEVYDNQGSATQYNGIELNKDGVNMVINNRVSGSSNREILTTSSQTNILKDNVIPGGSDSVASAASISLSDAFYTVGTIINITGTTNITGGVAASYDGHRQAFRFDDVLTVSDNGGSLVKMAGDFVTSADDILDLVCRGGVWYETSRSVN